jgi:hypothetical protein
VKIDGRAAMLGSLGSSSKPPGAWPAFHRSNGSGSRTGGATGGPVKIDGRAAMLGSLGSSSKPPGAWPAFHRSNGSGSRTGGATGGPVKIEGDLHQLVEVLNRRNWRPGEDRGPGDHAVETWEPFTAAGGVGNFDNAGEAW